MIKMNIQFFFIMTILNSLPSLMVSFVVVVVVVVVVSFVNGNEVNGSRVVSCR